MNELDPWGAPDPMEHDCVSCGIGPCDCAEIDPKTGEGCAECFLCNEAREASEEDE